MTEPFEKYLSSSIDNQRKMQAKLVELRRTIQFLCNAMSNAADTIDDDPAMARLILKDALNDERHEFR